MILSPLLDQSELKNYCGKAAQPPVGAVQVASNLVEPTFVGALFAIKRSGSSQR